MIWKLLVSYGTLLILFLFFAVLIQLIGVPGSGRGGTFQESRTRALESLNQVSRLVEQSLESWFFERRSDIEDLANLPQLHEAHRSPLVEEELTSFRRTHPQFSSVMIVDPRDEDGSSSILASPETLGFHFVGPTASLRIQRPLIGAQDPGRVVAILVAECPLAPKVAPVLLSIDQIQAHHWVAIVSGPQGEPFFQSQPGAGSNLGGFNGPYDGRGPGGAPFLALGRWVTVDDDLALSLTLGIPSQEVFSGAWDDLYRAIGLWGVITLGGLVLSAFLARQIVRPLETLATVTRKIAAGDLQARAPESDRTEIGDLARVFNAMVTQLQEHHEDQIRVISKNIQGFMLFQFVFEPSGTLRCTYASRSIIDLYGVTPEAVREDIGLIYRRVHPDDFPGLMESQTHARATMTRFQVEVRILDPSGTYRWSSIMSSPTSLASGGVQWDGVEFVVTELKTVQERARQQLEEIQEREAQFHHLADSGISLIWSSGPDGQYQYFNARWLKFRGRTFDQEKGDLWVEGIHPHDRIACLSSYHEAFEKREPFDREFRLRNAAGEYRWMNDLGSPNYSLKGEFLGYIGHCYDITEKRRVIETLQRNEKLEALGVLAGGVAHDFNNLLTGVFAFVDLARDSGKDNPEVVMNLDKALGAFQRAKSLTHQLLTFSKGGEPVRVSTDLAPLVRDVVGFALADSSIEREFDLEPGLWACDIDAHQIGQVLDNLTINAIQAMPDGGRLTVRARNLSGTLGPQVQVELTDTGVGIPLEQLSRVFDPFFTTKPKGTGLGLATSYSILQKHGGSIDVDSLPGKGSTFRIRLPASRRPPEIAGEKPSPDHPGQGTVVVMDDEAIVRELTQMWLERLGYAVVVTKNGDETLEYFASLPPGDPLPLCVFLDLTIPGGRGGRETLDELRRSYPDLPVFASSGYSEDPVMARPKDFGFTGSIPKPYLKDDLVAALSPIQPR